MKTLYVGFKGTSSSLVLDKLDDIDNDKAYLKGKLKHDIKFLSNLLSDKYYDQIIMLGDKPILNNKISVESCAFCVEFFCLCYRVGLGVNCSQSRFLFWATNPTAACGRGREDLLA